MTTRQTEQGVATARVEVSERLINPHGAVHGAVLFTMVDTAMGAATLSVLQPDQLCASIDVQLRFCKAVFAGELVATATVAQAGKRIIGLRADVRDSAGGLVAFGTGSFAVLGQPDRG